MKKFGARLLAAAVAGSLIVTPVMAAPSINDLKEDKAEKQSEVNSLQKELTDIMTKLGDLEEDLIKKGEEITQAEADLTVAEEKEKEQYEAMKLRIKYMYEEGSSMAIESLVSAEDFTDLVNKAEYVQNVHKYDRQQLQEYAETKQEIADLKTTLEEDQKTMEGLQDEYEAKETQLSSTIESKREEVADLDAQIQAAAEAAARAAAEEQRRREEEERRRQEEAAQSNNNTSSNQNRNNEDNNGGNASNDSASAGNTGSTGGSSTAGNTGSTGNSGSTGNTTGSTGTSTGSGSGSNLDYAGAGDSSVAQTIVNAAYGQLGVPYVWGGTSLTNGADCSGFVQSIYKQYGYVLPRVACDQAQYGVKIPVEDALPGDLIFYAKDGYIHHVVMYAGEGKTIEAMSTNAGIVQADVREGSAVWATRVLDDNGYGYNAGDIGEVNATKDMYGLNLGNFKLTYYCSCELCCDVETGITATGAPVVEGRTIAVDPRVIPYGTQVIIGGHVFTAEDCGGAIKGNRIDIYVNDHQKALELGVNYADVYLKK